jgi:hypothetical protein
VQEWLAFVGIAAALWTGLFVIFLFMKWHGG